MASVDELGSMFRQKNYSPEVREGPVKQTISHGKCDDITAVAAATTTEEKETTLPTMESTGAQKRVRSSLT